MKIRHQVELPHTVEEAKGLIARIRDNRWTPVVVMTAITLCTVKACSSKPVTITINNYTSEIDH